MSFQDKKHILLIVVPPHTVFRPNIGVSILKKILENEGHHCDIYYANAEFAKAIGVDNYRKFETWNSYIIDYVFSVGFSNIIKKTFKHDDTFLIEDAKNKALVLINDIAEKVNLGNYDLIGFSLKYASVPSIVIAKKIKELINEPKIIFGGVNCLGDQGLAMHENFPWIDYICRGEGENLILEIVEALLGEDEKLENIQGLIWRKNGKSICNGQKTRLVSNLDEIPCPDYSDWYSVVTTEDFFEHKNKLNIPFESSRGCWYGQKRNCIFCGLCGEDLTYRSKSPEKTISEIKELSQFNIKDYLAVDLIFPKQYFKTLIPKLTEENLDLTLFYETKANLTKEQIALFAKASIMLLQAGIESLSTPILQIMRKGIKAYLNIRLLKWGFEYGMDIFWNLIYGFPNEPQEEYYKMAKLIPLISHLQPPSGFPYVRLDRFSPLYEERADFGITEIWPAQPYMDIYPLPKEQIMRLVSSFEYRKDDPEKLPYIIPLRKEIIKWKKEARETIFFSININGTLFFYDTRSIAKSDYSELQGFEKSVYEACDAGKSIQAICEFLDEPEYKVKAVLDELIQNDKIVYIDNKYLSLAVSMDNAISGELDKDIAISLCSQIYTSWMAAKHIYQID